MYASVMHEYGDPRVLELQPVPDPPVRPGWVTVRIEAAAVNWHDVLVRRGRYGSALPHVPGADGAGVRLDTGEPVVIVPSLCWGARQAAPGADWEILGDRLWGTYAEQVSVPEQAVVSRPAGYSVAEAAALPLVGLTTYRALFVRGRLRAGESVLVLGASGGVATMATVMASAAGARAVVTSSSAAKIARARELGAVAGVDHGETPWVEAARAETPAARGFDLVLDAVGRWDESVACLRPGGRLVVLGASAHDEARLPIRPFYFGQFELIGTTMGSAADMAAMLTFMEEFRVRPPLIDSSFPLAAAADAHARLESGEAFGKIVLLP